MEYRHGKFCLVFSQGHSLILGQKSSWLETLFILVPSKFLLFTLEILFYTDLCLKLWSCISLSEVCILISHWWKTYFGICWNILQVLQENSVKKEELKARAVALKILGKIFQVWNPSNFTVALSHSARSKLDELDSGMPKIT